MNAVTQQLFSTRRGRPLGTGGSLCQPVVHHPAEEEKLGLFGRSKENGAAAENAQGEVERINALPVEELAAEIMPAFGPDGARGGREINALQISNWMMRSCSGGAGHLRELHQAVCEGVQVLEHAELVQVFSGERGSFATGAHAKATRLGVKALANDEVADRIRDRR